MPTSLVGDVVAITLLVVTRDGIDYSVLVALGFLAAWPLLGLLWLFLDRRATSRIDRLTSVEKYELYNTLEKNLLVVWIGFSGIVAAFVGTGCVLATDYAPTHFDALVAWGAFLALSGLSGPIYRWALRKAARESEEKKTVKGWHISCP